MRVIAESTHQLATVNGQRCRIWNGLSEGGKPCYLFVMFLSVETDDDDPAFLEALTPTSAPKIEIHVEDILEGG